MTQPHRELIEYHPTLSANDMWFEAGVRIAKRIPTLLKFGPRRFWRTGTRLGGDPADRVAFRPSHKILISDVRLRLERASRSACWLPRRFKMVNGEWEISSQLLEIEGKHRANGGSLPFSVRAEAYRRFME